MTYLSDFSKGSVFVGEGEEETVVVANRPGPAAKNGSARPRRKLKGAACLDLRWYSLTSRAGCPARPRTPISVCQASEITLPVHIKQKRCSPTAFALHGLSLAVAPFAPKTTYINVCTCRQSRSPLQSSPSQTLRRPDGGQRGKGRRHGKK